MTKYSTLLFTFMVLILTISCSDDDDNPVVQNQTFLESNAALIDQIKTNYANIVLASYEDALSTARSMQTALTAFTDAPSDATLTAAKASWLAAREVYGLTEAYRFANGPIDDENGPEGLLNAWPLDESYIDYVNHSVESNVNIVNDTAGFPEITKEVLENLNEAGGTNERSVSVGYHAIEFLLWGQDTQDPVDGAEGTTGGQRPFTDFVDGGTATNQDRRRQYLTAAAELLIDNLQYLVDSWSTSGNNYRSEFLALNSETSLRNIIGGAATLVGPELAGERINVALENTSQEDEHSCFSDNTHRDIILNFEGVRNVYEGSYTRLNGSTVSGSSIQDLGAQLTEAAAVTIYNDLNAKFAEAAANVNNIHIPFDYAIFDDAHRPTVDASAVSLQEVADLMGELSAAFDVDVVVALPE